MGSEMCIRDRIGDARRRRVAAVVLGKIDTQRTAVRRQPVDVEDCLLYTSDAADERSVKISVVAVSLKKKSTVE